MSHAYLTTRMANAYEPGRPALDTPLPALALCAGCGGIVDLACAYIVETVVATPLDVRRRHFDCAQPTLSLAAAREVLRQRVASTVQLDPLIAAVLRSELESAWRECHPSVRP
jgi:hypothetical protein